MKRKRVAFSLKATNIIEWSLVSLFCILFIVLCCLLIVLTSALFESKEYKLFTFSLLYKTIKK